MDLQLGNRRWSCPRTQHQLRLDRFLRAKRAMEDQWGRPGRDSFPSTSATGSGRFSARWLRSGEALLQQEPIRGHILQVDYVAVTWQGLITDTPREGGWDGHGAGCLSHSSSSFSFHSSLLGCASRGWWWGDGCWFSSSFSRTSEKESSRPLALAVYLGLRPGQACGSSGSFFLPHIICRWTLDLPLWMLAAGAGAQQPPSLPSTTPPLSRSYLLLPFLWWIRP